MLCLNKVATYREADELHRRADREWRLAEISGAKAGANEVKGEMPRRGVEFLLTNARVAPCIIHICPGFIFCRVRTIGDSGGSCLVRLIHRGVPKRHVVGPFPVRCSATLSVLTPTWLLDAVHQFLKLRCSVAEFSASSTVIARHDTNNDRKPSKPLLRPASYGLRRHSLNTLTTFLLQSSKESHDARERAVRRSREDR